MAFGKSFRAEEDGEAFQSLPRCIEPATAGGAGESQRTARREHSSNSHNWTAEDVGHGHSAGERARGGEAAPDTPVLARTAPAVKVATAETGTNHRWTSRPPQAIAHLSATSTSESPRGSIQVETKGSALECNVCAQGALDGDEVAGTHTAHAANAKDIHRRAAEQKNEIEEWLCEVAQETKMATTALQVCVVQS